MSERRQAFRREPIEVELDSERVISVAPCAWEDRNTIGNAIIEQNTASLNEAIVMYTDPDSGAPQLNAKLANKLTDPLRVLSLGLGDDEYRKATSQPLYLNQITELLVAILDVNDLKHLRPLVDPNSQTPDAIGGIISTILQTEDGDTLKTESGLDSSPEVSPATPSEPSPIPS